MYYFSDQNITRKYFDSLLEKMEVNTILMIGAIFTKKQKMLPFATMQVYIKRQPASRKYASFTYDKILYIVRVK